MAVTIKKSGVYNFKPFEVTCGNCNSLLEVSDLNDIKVKEYPGQGEMGGSTALLRSIVRLVVVRSMCPRD